MYSEKRRFGNKGEDIACRFLEMNHFSILDRNFLKKQGEIDIVAEKEGKIVFIEVKTISRESGYRAEDNVHPEKLRRLGSVVEMYRGEKGVEDREWGFAVVVVELDDAAKIARVKLLDDLVL